MSYCKREGEHKSVFLTAEDLSEPETVTSIVSEEEEEEEYGVILPNGEINWDCPCLGGIPHGPCGQEFRDAFSCFHFSTEEEKGSDCIEKFKSMQECFQRHPELYKDFDEDLEAMEEGKESEDPTGQKSNDSKSLTNSSTSDDGSSEQLTRNSSTNAS